jgi:hypothetical protein
MGMGMTANSSANEMTASEHEASERLIHSLHQVIQGVHPSIAAHALLSVAAGVVATFVADPATKAKSLADELVATGERPLKPGTLNCKDRSFAQAWASIALRIPEAFVHEA